MAKARTPAALDFQAPQLMLCGGVCRTDVPERLRTPAVRSLTLTGRANNVRLHIEQLSRVMRSTLPDVCLDALEVASYVFIADQSVRRGATNAFDYGRRWQRELRVIVPVRRPDVWSQPLVRSRLEHALRFLSDDLWQFHFVRHPAPVVAQRYLTDGLANGPSDWDDVQLFSGGLDSLGGAVAEILHGQRRIVLVSHRSHAQTYARQRHLLDAIARRLPHPRLTPLHVTITVNHRDQEAVEHTQRTRSFLFATMAAVTAHLVGRDRVRFFENGITSLNLPVSGELVGAQASRTTHPQALHLLSCLFAALFERPFAIHNPYQWHTKAEVIQHVHALGHADLIRLTGSCVHPREWSRTHTHCGRCSQCLDRRLAVLGAGLTDDDDPAGAYRTDVVLGERRGADWTLVERYTGFASEMDSYASPASFLAHFPAVHQSLRYLDCDPTTALDRVYELHRRHANTMAGTLQGLIAAHANRIARQDYPAHCLLGVVVGRVSPSRPIPADGLARPARTPAAGLVVDRSRFEARWGDRTPLSFGNTREFRLLEFLNDQSGRFVTLDAIRAAVWDERQIERNTIHQVVCNLRRMLRTAFPEVTLDGSKVGHYRLMPTDAPDDTARRPASTR